MYYLP